MPFRKPIKKIFQRKTNETCETKKRYPYVPPEIKHNLEKFEKGENTALGEIVPLLPEMLKIAEKNGEEAKLIEETFDIYAKQIRILAQKGELNIPFSNHPYIDQLPFARAGYIKDTKEIFSNYPFSPKLKGIGRPNGGDYPIRFFADPLSERPLPIIFDDKNKPIGIADSYMLCYGATKRELVEEAYGAWLYHSILGVKYGLPPAMELPVALIKLKTIRKKEKEINVEEYMKTEIESVFKKIGETDIQSIKERGIGLSPLSIWEETSRKYGRQQEIWELIRKDLKERIGEDIGEYENPKKAVEILGKHYQPCVAIYVPVGGSSIPRIEKEIVYTKEGEGEKVEFITGKSAEIKRIYPEIEEILKAYEKYFEEKGIKEEKEKLPEIMKNTIEGLAQIAVFHKEGGVLNHETRGGSGGWSGILFPRNVGFGVMTDTRSARRIENNEKYIQREIRFAADTVKKAAEILGFDPEEQIKKFKERYKYYQSLEPL